MRHGVSREATFEEKNLTSYAGKWSILVENSTLHKSFSGNKKSK